MIKMEIVTTARCKHCKHAKQGTFTKIDGTWSKKLITVCKNKDSKMYNTQIAMRDIVCEKIEL